MISKQQIILMVIFCIFFTQTISASHANKYPNSFTAFRDTVYMQNKSLPETMRLYTAAKQEIENSLSGADKFVLLSKCEYLMGITFRADNKNNEAETYFKQGIVYADKSIQIHPTSEGYRLLGTNISFLCEVNTYYGQRYYKKIEESAQRALELDHNNLIAKYLIAAFYISTPLPVSDVRIGMRLLEEIIQQNYSNLDWEDQFNLFLMLQTACFKLNRNHEAQIWRAGCEAIYPTNNFIRFLVE